MEKLNNILEKTKEASKKLALLNEDDRNKIILNISYNLIKYKDEIKNQALSEEYFKKFNRIVFAQRRKTLANNLKSGFGYSKELIESILTSNQISLTIRTEALSVEQIVKLANEFYLAQKN